MKTNKKDIILLVNPPEPVSNRHYGLNSDDLKALRAKMKMVCWFIIISALLLLQRRAEGGRKGRPSPPKVTLGGDCLPKKFQEIF